VNTHIGFLTIAVVGLFVPWWWAFIGCGHRPRWVFPWFLIFLFTENDLRKKQNF